MFELDTVACDSYRCVNCVVVSPTLLSLRFLSVILRITLSPAAVYAGLRIEGARGTEPYRHHSLPHDPRRYRGIVTKLRVNQQFGE